MFENIVGQEHPVAVVRRELEQQRFPRAALLHGPAYAGKLSMALEIARVLACSQGGAWSCSCPHCLQHRDLSYPYLIMMGWRYFSQEIQAAADVLRRSRKTAAHYFFIRAVRKLTRRYDRLLWEGEESRLRGVTAAVSELNELVDLLTPRHGAGADGDPAAAQPDGDQSQLEQRCAKIQELAAKVIASIKTENVPISQIRNVERWLHLSSGEGRKVVILEHAEGVQESSRNALLRLLEEPPAAANIIVLARRPEALIPTLRSRLRAYALRERPLPQQREVLQRIFREQDESYDSLRSYFLNWHEISPERLRGYADRFLAAVTAPQAETRDWVSGPTGGYARAAGLPQPLPKELLQLFLEELLESLRGWLARPSDAATPHRDHVYAAWACAIDEVAARTTMLNMQGGHSLQSLGRQLRAIWTRGRSSANDMLAAPRGPNR